MGLPNYQDLAQLARRLRVWFPLHQMVFSGGVFLLFVIDWFLLDGWALFWPTIIWVLLFGLHYLIYKSQSIDEDWVEERIWFDVYKPWDYGHIEDIRKNPFGGSNLRTDAEDEAAEAAKGRDADTAKKD